MTTLPPIANRVARIKRGEDPQLIGKLPSGYAILSNQQPDALTGCCMLLPDPTPAHLSDLKGDARAQFLMDFAALGDAVMDATGADRINYLMLCNQVPELHAHVVPRFDTEDPELRKLDPLAAYDFGQARRADATGPDAELLKKLQQSLAARANITM